MATKNYQFQFGNILFNGIVSQITKPLQLVTNDMQAALLMYHNNGFRFLLYSIYGILPLLLYILAVFVCNAIQKRSADDWSAKRIAS